MEYVFNDSWVIAGRVEEIPNSGDYFTFKKLKEPMIIIRGADGVIRCFITPANIVELLVVREEKGSDRRLRCQYHSWTYDITDGTLIALPDERDFVDLR